MLKLQNISLAYDKSPVVDDVSFSITAGETACLIGPSGSGKTSVLRAIAGFQPIFSGTIQLRGTTVNDNNKCVAPEKRRFSMVFQDYALFPHLTVEENVRFALKHLKRADAKYKAADMLALVGLSQKAQRYCHQLSGGQQQRVAVARALAPDPDLLLLDEPFSNLDADLRAQLSRELRDILKERDTTTLMVTHDQTEAFCMADTLGVIISGKLRQWGSPEDVYSRPTSTAVAEFVGESSYLQGRVVDNQHVETQMGRLRCIEHQYPPNHQVRVLIRPEMICFNPAAANKAKIVEKDFRGADSRYTVELNSGDRLRAVGANHLTYNVGDLCGINLINQPVTLLDQND